MSDLTDRLRHNACDATRPSMQQTLTDAATEIERLQTIITNRDTHIEWLTDLVRKLNLQLEALNGYPL